MPTAFDNRIPDADLAFPFGADSVTDPEIMSPGWFVRAFNTVTRGARVRCRPGYLQMYCLPEGRLQGAYLYRPTNSAAQILVAVGGFVYAATAPFHVFEKLQGIQFSEHSQFVNFCQAEQAVIRNTDGSLTLITPKSVVVVQDGITAPGVWDGVSSYHASGDFSVPVGTVMTWSGDRLWVANGKRLFASDYANPLSFFEGKYLNDGTTSIGAFMFRNEITAMAELNSLENPFLVVFTRESTEAVLTYIRQRDAWDSVAGFIRTLYPTIGCVGPNAWALFNGMLWWFSPMGLINLNSAETGKQNSEIEYLDTAMAVSKKSLSPDLSGVALGSFENYLLVSVPHADKHNTHTWVYDSDVARRASVDGAGWQSYWVGTRPVIWLSGTINNEARSIHFSVDYDGRNRVWDSFQADRLDNGCPILWGFETRSYVRLDRTNTWMRYADLHFADLPEDAEIKVFWAGTTRGPYKPLMYKEAKITRGSVDAQVELDARNEVFAYKSQSRWLRTEDVRRKDPDAQTSREVESDNAENFDFGFQLFVTCLGAGSVRAIKVFGQPEPDERTGVCQPKDEAELAVRFDGASAVAETKQDALELLSVGPISYQAAASSVVSYRGVSAIGLGDAETSISVYASRRLAQRIADMRAARTLSVNAPFFLGGGSVCQEIQAGAVTVSGSEL